MNSGCLVRNTSAVFAVESMEKKQMAKQNRFLKNTYVLIAAACFAVSGTATEVIPPPGGIPCEADWTNRSRFDTVASAGYLQYLERQAERGELAVQLRLGLVRSTRDGQWSAPKDNSYNIRWLEKAQAQGSKSATWELANLKRRETTHEAYLRAAMEAAEEEGNPWAATHLMNLTNGRYGSRSKPTACAESAMVDHQCAPPELLPISTARKWAEIAAEGGNAQAQEWLCVAAAEGKPERGQPQDDKEAFKWCQIAVRNTCAYWPLMWLGILNKKGMGEDASRIKQWNKQPWRNPSGHFFAP